MQTQTNWKLDWDSPLHLKRLAKELNAEGWQSSKAFYCDIEPPRIIKAYPYQYSCGGYWIGETFNDGTIKCLSGKRTVLSREQVIQRLGDNAVFSA